MDELAEVCATIEELRDQLDEAYTVRAIVMAAAHEDGATLREIAEVAGISHVAVRKAIDQHYGLQEVARMLRSVGKSRPADRGGQSTVRRPRA